MMLTFEAIILILVISLSAIFIALYLYFTRNFEFWKKLGIPYVKPTPFVGNLKECVFQKVNIGKQLQQIYEQHSDKPYVGIFSFDKPSLLIRDLELVKNILVKDFQNFTDRITSSDEKLDPLFSRALFVIKGQRWRHWRTNLTPVFTSGKMKMMFYLVDTCGKELADCLDKASYNGK
jgi:cytochrome P450 family 6